MGDTGSAVCLRGALGAILLAGVVGSTPVAAQVPAACAPESAFGVTLTTQERSLDVKPIATHPVTVTAEVDGSADDVTVTPPPGTRVLAGGAGDGGVEVVMPAAPGVAMTVTWSQPIDPSGESDESCAASRVITLPVLSARPARALRTPNLPSAASIAVVPARKRPSLDPLEISIATVGQARVPPASARRRTMAVPLRPEDSIRYDKPLPSLSFIKTPKLCRFFFLSCGAVTTKVAALQIDDEALSRGVVRGNPTGPASLLARTQPGRRAASLGVIVDTGPAKNKVYGLELEIRQSGRLLGRVVRAGRCRSGRTYRCTVTRSSTKLG